ncbi:Planctomycete cytochrome C [Lacipirellula limnantheis]|uniref:Planctomycete cytochrome C n=2 Tax=Lacipirellula limnantheis TaxID=2528024 RepID=A0A517U4F7_9BACT|nr:Planctomycete cytochrome C [Lacipirellula limnantheis]
MPNLHLLRWMSRSRRPGGVRSGALERLLCVAIGGALGAGVALAAAVVAAGGDAAEVGGAERVDYARDVKPIFAARCVACHGALKQEAGLRLDTGEFARRGGDSGAVLAPGDAAGSLLVARVTAADLAERMPPEGEALAPEQTALLAAWIAQGAASPADERPDTDPREHWAFRPLVRPATPHVGDGGWGRNPIDAFVADYQQRHGLRPQVEATRGELVRRLYFDLLGLPPTPAELASLDADQSPDWYERLADRLLADPRHGQRWARHWMDVWRYSDWWGLGEQLRNSQPHIWHWRDWIVESLNADLPYDEMVRLMLAADELHPNDLDKLRASGFLARNYVLFNRTQWMDETVEHVGKAFLGLTFNCAKCHDHKYDPIAQVDYYRMRAFFEPYHVRLDVVPGEADLGRDGIPRAFDGAGDAPTYLFVRGQETQPDKSQAILPGVPELLAFRELNVQPVSLPVEAWQPERRAWVREAYLAAAAKRVAAAEADLAAVLSRGATTEVAAEEALANAQQRAAEQALVAAVMERRSVETRCQAMAAGWAAADDQTQAATADTRALAAAAVAAERQAAVAQASSRLADVELRLLRAAAEAKAPLETELNTARQALEEAKKLAAAPAAEADRFTPLVGAKWTPTRFLNSTADDPTVTGAPQSTGRRRALAEWITDPQNPLTARVAVNHLWARHLGTPLVATTFDFGRKGNPPTHVELLDWLAAELIESGWSMKHVHRLIVNSATYRLSSSVAARETNRASDPDNAGWWRRTPIRLESQAVRDSILALAGTLDLTPGGPPVPPAEQAASRRRSLYFFHSNNERQMFLTAFDEASVSECYRREESIVPQQALALTNSELVLDSSKVIAEQLAQVEDGGAVNDDATFVRRAFRTLLGIDASDAEVAFSVQALAAWRQIPEQTERSPRANLVWVLLNHNDFVTLR